MFRTLLVLTIAFAMWKTPSAIAQQAAAGFLAGPDGASITKQQLEAHLELALLRRVFKLTEQQEAAFEEQAIGLRLQEVPPPLPQHERPKVSSAELSRRLKKTIAEVLTEQQQAEWDAVKRSRQAFRRESDTDTLLECLQRRLWLTDQQREAIKGELADWMAGKSLMMSMYLSNDSYIPNIPEQIVAPHLTAHQKTVFRRLQKADFSWDQFNRGQQQVLIEK